jgi:2-(1,2-epoxy-1,2-dihydrophenyl)acetyl-CoA isomerase
MTDTSASPKLSAEVVGRVGVITLNDPATLNAASVDLLTDLRKAFDGFVDDDNVRAIVITGEGRGFCSGANLSPSANAKRTPSKGPLRSLIEVYNPLISAIRKSPKPIVAAVNGVAAGVGVSLALVCDLVVASESAYFLLAFRRIGTGPDGGTSWLLPRFVGKARAMELILLGEKLSAKTAQEWGLINRCVPDIALRETTLELAGALANGPSSLALARNLVWEALDADWHAQIEAEAFAQGEALRSEDCREGVLAFVEKRPAKFTGR